MGKENTQPLDEAVEQTIEQAQQVIEQTRAEIARSQALSQAEAGLARSIERIAEDHDGPTHDQ
jgi:hypothetical protein